MVLYLSPTQLMARYVDSFGSRAFYKKMLIIFTASSFIKRDGQLSDVLLSHRFVGALNSKTYVGSLSISLRISKCMEN